MRAEFGQEYIRDEFDRIGATLDEKIVVFLLGGGAMAFRDLKDATKDIDVIVQHGGDLDRLETALQQLDYQPVRDVAEEYADLGAQLILENGDGCRFDIFNQQVVDKLILSEGMQDRSQPLETSGTLDVRLVAAEDIFLFKSVAGRADDIEDMNTLVQTGLDFDTVLDELRHQIELLDEELFVTHVNEALVDLEDRFGVTTPIHEEIRAISARVYDQLSIVLTIDDVATVDELQEELDLSGDRLTDMLDDLERKGNIERDGNTVRKLDDRP